MLVKLLISLDAIFMKIKFAGVVKYVGGAMCIDCIFCDCYALSPLGYRLM